MYFHPNLARPLAEARMADLHKTAIGLPTGAPRRPRRRVPRIDVRPIAHTPRSAR